MHSIRLMKCKQMFLWTPQLLSTSVRNPTPLNRTSTSPSEAGRRAANIDRHVCDQRHCASAMQYTMQTMQLRSSVLRHTVRRSGTARPAPRHVVAIRAAKDSYQVGLRRLLCFVITRVVLVGLHWLGCTAIRASKPAHGIIMSLLCLSLQQSPVG